MRHLFSHRFLGGILAACALSACNTTPVSGVDSVAQSGRSWQGRSWQGRSWQGRSWQGTGYAGSTVQGVRVGGVDVASLHVEGSALAGTLGGAPIRGVELRGATVIQDDADGSLWESTITEVETDSADPSGETLLYTLTALNPDTGLVENLCAPDRFGVAKAVVLSGRWDSTGAHSAAGGAITLGCTSGVLAKCVRWGYRPWQTVGGRSLTDYHQACTRMARADYCGDGTSHTEDGTEIDMYDDLGIQQRTPMNLLSPMLFDAAWSPSGAYCIQKERWMRLLTLTSIPDSCRQKFQLALLTTSPVDARDLCLVVRPDVAPSSVRMDNQSGLNVSLY